MCVVTCTEKGKVYLFSPAGVPLENETGAPFLSLSLSISAFQKVLLN